MELIDYLRLLRRRWFWVVGFVVIGIVLGGLWVVSTPKLYRATAIDYVGNVSSPTSVNSTAAVQAASEYVLAEMPSFAALVATPDVANPVISSLGLNESVATFDSHISASVPTLTVLIKVNATSHNPETAMKVANATATNLGTVIEKLPAPAGGGVSPVRVTLTTPATTPKGPISPDKKLGIALGLLGGLAVGLLAASLRDQSRTNPVAPTIPTGPSGPTGTEAHGRTRSRRSRGSGAGNSAPGIEHTAPVPETVGWHESSASAQPTQA